MSEQHLKLRCNELELELCVAASRIEALEAALRPFARAAEVFDGFKGSYREPASRAICSFVPENFKGDIFDKKHPDLAPITYGDCRNARAALAPEQER